MSIDFAYTQARVQARLGERLTESSWQLIESARSLSQYLSSVRASALARRVRRFPSPLSPHAIERSLRADWRDEVCDVARWVPQRWRAAVEWTAWLSDLEAIAFLFRGEQVLPWMKDDPVLTALALGDSAARRVALESSPYADLVDDATVTKSLDDNWLVRWRELWPKTNAVESSELNELVTIVLHYIHARRDQARLPGERSESRARLNAYAARALRLQSQQPVIVFCHLLMMGLDLLRLREGLLRRALFDSMPMERAR